MSTPAPAAPLSIRQVLAIPASGGLWSAQLVSIFGEFGDLTPCTHGFIPLHRSARQVSLITVFFLLPLRWWGPSPVLFVDRWHAKRDHRHQRRRARSCWRSDALCERALARLPGVLCAEYLLQFLVPAQSVTLPQIVPIEGLLSANATIQQAMRWRGSSVLVIRGARRLAGRAVRGQVYLDSVTFLFSAVMISQIAIPMRPRHATAEMKSVVGDLFSGMRFILTHEIISFVILSISAGTFAMSAFGALDVGVCARRPAFQPCPVRHTRVHDRRRHVDRRLRDHQVCARCTTRRC